MSLTLSGVEPCPGSAMSTPSSGSPNEYIAAVAASIRKAAAIAIAVHSRAGLRLGRKGGSWAKAS
jgi:hypothetical protein